MTTGKLDQAVGFSATAGHIRKLGVREQLIQVRNSRQSGDINHPMLGKITVTVERAVELVELYDEPRLIRLKKLLFAPLGA